MAHELVELALRAIGEYLEKGKIIKAPPESPFLLEKAGVFVSLKKRGKLRGCIGTFVPNRANAAEETIHNAINAAVNDPRFPPVSADEMEKITCSVDLLSEPESASFGELDPEKYGVIVESGNKRGLLLPDLEGVDTAREQVKIAKNKACILPGEPCRLFRFKVRRFT